MKKLLIVCSMILLCSGVAFAGGDELEDSWDRSHLKQHQSKSKVKAQSENDPVPDSTPNQASDASFDKRLPPVLPGEHVNDSGRQMKVWSTAGPVPVSEAPEPWRKTKKEDLKEWLGPVGVVVDQRKDGRHHKGSSRDTEGLKTPGTKGKVYSGKGK